MPYNIVYTHENFMLQEELKESFPRPGHESSYTRQATIPPDSAHPANRILDASEKP